MEISGLWQAEDTANTIVPNVRNVVEISEDAFDEVLANYMDNPSALELPEGGFAGGRVFLIYGGEINSCEAHLKFNETLSATDVSDLSVKIKIGYNEVEGKTACSPTISHPFWIYYIKTTKKLAFEDDIK